MSLSFSHFSLSFYSFFVLSCVILEHFSYSFLVVSSKVMTTSYLWAASLSWHCAFICSNWVMYSDFHAGCTGDWATSEIALWASLSYIFIWDMFCCFCYSYCWSRFICSLSCDTTAKSSEGHSYSTMAEHSLKSSFTFSFFFYSSNLLLRLSFYFESSFTLNNAFSTVIFCFFFITSFSSWQFYRSFVRSSFASKSSFIYSSALSRKCWSLFFSASFSFASCSIWRSDLCWELFCWSLKTYFWCAICLTCWSA